MPESRAPITPEMVAVLAATADLAISSERARELAPHLESVMERMGRLRGIDVTQHEPALIFRLLPRP